jgi:hypothetical protein
VPVTAAEISCAAIFLQKQPMQGRKGKWIATRRVCAGCFVDAVRSKAIIARLRAARMLGLGAILDEFGEATLAAVIASAPLHPIGGYHYFDADEFVRWLKAGEE